MTELQVLRWFENPESLETYDEEAPRCKWCKEVEGDCSCIDDWKLED